jgi:hypothetical protein
VGKKKVRPLDLGRERGEGQRLARGGLAVELARASVRHGGSARPHPHGAATRSSPEPGETRRQISCARRAVAKELSCSGEDRRRSLQLPSWGRDRQEESRDRREGTGVEMEV